MKGRHSSFVRAIAHKSLDDGRLRYLALLAVLICALTGATSCVKQPEKAAEVVDEISQALPVDTIKLQQAVADIRFTFGMTDAGRKSGWSGEPDDVCFSLSGPALYDKTNAIIIAYPPKPAGRPALLDEAVNVNATMASTAMQDAQGMRYAVSHGQNLYVLYIDSGLMRLLEPGRTIRELDANDYSESEFRQKFPQGMDAAFTLDRKPDGRFVIEIGSKTKKKELIGGAEAVEYVCMHGNPWACWRDAYADPKTGKMYISYFVREYTVNLKAAEFPMAPLILDNLKDVVAVSKISSDGRAELIDDDRKVASIVKRLLGGESKYEIDF
jgi:hypothetical protein